MKKADKAAEIIIEAAEGLTRREWRQIAELIDRKFEEAANRVQFSREDAERAKDLYRVER